MSAPHARPSPRLGLNFRAVAPDPGAIGGPGSHEFRALADSGEDAIAWSPQSQYAANVELAEALSPQEKRKQGSESMKKVPTPGKKTCEEVAELLKLPLQRTVKSVVLAVPGDKQTQLFLLLIRGGHPINEAKVSQLPDLANFRFASE